MVVNTNYQSYLLRLWRDGADQPWRASLQSTATEEVERFGDLQALFAFLLDQLTTKDNACDPPSAHTVV